MLNFRNTRLLFVIIMAMMFGLDIYGVAISFYWYLIPLLSYLLLIVIGSYRIEWQFFIKSINKSDLKSNKIALTFDDGPHQENTMKVLDVLDKYNAKATFFCIGSKMAANKNIIDEIVNRGHSVGNHSFNHRHSFPMHSTKKMVDEIEQTNIEIQKYTGKENNLFRPPFGVTNPRIARAVKQTKMKVIGWSIRSFDTVGNDVQKVVKRVINNLQGGSVVLLHDDRENTAKILEGILQYMEEQKMKSVGVEELLELN